MCLPSLGPLAAHAWPLPCLAMDEVHGSPRMCPDPPVFPLDTRYRHLSQGGMGRLHGPASCRALPSCHARRTALFAQRKDPPVASTGLLCNCVHSMLHLHWAGPPVTARESQSRQPVPPRGTPVSKPYRRLNQNINISHKTQYNCKASTMDGDMALPGTLVRYGSAGPQVALLCGPASASRALILIGGLTDGLLYAPYVVPMTKELTARGWMVVHASLQSSWTVRQGAECQGGCTVQHALGRCFCMWAR